MKKSITSIQTMVLIIAVFIASSMILATQAEASPRGAYINKLIHQNKNKLTRIADGIDNKTLTKVVPSARALSKTLDIPATMLASPAVRKMAVVGEDIVSHGAFASKMLNNSSIPESVIRQYSHYGKKAYLDTAEAVAKKMTIHKGNTLNGLEVLKGKYKGMNNVINKFNAGSYDNDIFVRIIKKTGKRGNEVLGVLAKHKKISSSGAAMVWYLNDPESFEAALQASGKSLGNFIAEIVVGVSGGIGTGVISGLTSALSRFSLPSIFIGGAFLLLAFTFFSKTLRRIIFMPFTFFLNNINAKLDQIETNTNQQTPPNEAKKSARETLRKPRNNL
ncbi:MAG: hypothetical protein V7721_10560 [Porticoccaceae bacterium]